MELPQPYIVRYKTISPREAANLLHTVNIEDTIALPPVKPKAGDVFIYANKDAKGNIFILCNFKICVYLYYF